MSGRYLGLLRLGGLLGRGGCSCSGVGHGYGVGGVVERVRVLASASDEAMCIAGCRGYLYPERGR